jgi:rare lipoprotein A
VRKIFYIFVIIFLFSGCVSQREIIFSSNSYTQRPYRINGKTYFPKKRIYIGWTQRGIASWYGPHFHGRYTSNGEIYNMYAFTAAHKTLPMNTIVKVTNLNNGKSVIVRINDRGPFVKGRIIDLSYAAGKKIGLDKTGIAPVKLEVIGFNRKILKKNYFVKKKHYLIQIGAFKKFNGAKNFAKKFKYLGYNTIIKKIGGLNKVFIIGFKTYTSAKKFKIKYGINGFIVGD